LHTDERAAHVRGKNLIPHFDRGVFKIAARGQTDIVDEHINTAIDFNRPINQGATISFNANVGSLKACLAARADDAFGNRCAIGFVNVGDHNAASLTGKQPGDTLTHSGARGGNYSNAIF
jgi:hypothetical protein